MQLILKHQFSVKSLILPDFLEIFLICRTIMSPFPIRMSHRDRLLNLLETLKPNLQIGP